LQLSPDSRLGRVGEDVSRDLATVVGNLVDNALDAVTGTPEPTVDVRIEGGGGSALVVVRDSGPGVPDADLEAVFRQGFTTKQPTTEGERGYGLALSRVVCQRSGGQLTVHNDGGAVFTAKLATRKVDA
jgi:sensor histidine kinase regulating citrate/malate metabolism